MREDNARLSIIAVEVGNSNHGGFLTHLAAAWSSADRDNKNLMREFWQAICIKYNLYEKYANAIKTELPGYMEITT